MLSLYMLFVGSLATTLIICFVCSWKFSVGFIAFIPIVAVLNILKIRMYQTTTKEEQESLEWAGKVCHISIFKDTDPWRVCPVCQGIYSFMSYALLAITKLPNNELTSIHTLNLAPLLL